VDWTGQVYDAKVFREMVVSCEVESLVALEEYGSPTPRVSLLSLPLFSCVCVFCVCLCVRVRDVCARVYDCFSHTCEHHQMFVLSVFHEHPVSHPACAIGFVAVCVRVCDSCVYVCKRVCSSPFPPCAPGLDWVDGSVLRVGHCNDVQHGAVQLVQLSAGHRGDRQREGHDLHSHWCVHSATIA
jgi:hypothetical protein